MKPLSRSAALLASLMAFGMTAAPHSSGDGRVEVRAGSQSNANSQPGTQGPAFPTLAERLMSRVGIGGRWNDGTGGYRNRAGWTTRRYQRHAQKLRNRARNRRACRG